MAHDVVSNKFGLGEERFNIRDIAWDFGVEEGEPMTSSWALTFLHVYKAIHPIVFDVKWREKANSAIRFWL